MIRRATSTSYVIATQESERGYHNHHIIGQHTENRLQFGDDRIYSYENEVRIPALKHLDLNGWYSRPNERYGGLSPRDYLRGKSWDAQMQVGLDILRDKGIIK